MTTAMQPAAARSAEPDERADRDATIAGVAAAAVALGVGELISAFGRSQQSLVASVGNGVIETVPGDVARGAIDVFGRNDKPALVIGTVVLALVFGGLLGRWTSRRRWVGAVGITAFGAVGLLAGLDDPLTSKATVVTAAVGATIAGIATLYGLLLVREGRLTIYEDVADDRPGMVTATPGAGATRRTFFTWAGGLTAFGALLAAGGRRLATSSPAEEARQALLAEDSTPIDLPTGLEAEVDELTPLVTPNADFYLIDEALVKPHVDPADWDLTIDGMVDEPFSLGYDELRSLATVEEQVTLACVSNQIGGDLISNAIWTGVPLVDLLDRAGVQEGADQIVGHSIDRWTAGFPTEVAFDGRTALVATEMNGEPLPVNHGFPARLVVAGLYGYVSATKWLTRIELTRWDDFDGYWIQRGWSKEGPIKTQSRIDVPRRGASIEAGTQAIAGVAWAQSRGIEAVEVQIDDGDWIEAELGPATSENTWVQWVVSWDAQPGDHVIRVRATDKAGDTQTEERRPPEPSGATGWHTVRVEVA